MKSEIYQKNLTALKNRFPEMARLINDNEYILEEDVNIEVRRRQTKHQYCLLEKMGENCFFREKDSQWKQRRRY